MYRSIKEVESYLSEVKAAISAGRYRVALNPRRQANLQLYKDYVVTESKLREIILDLTAYDFCAALQNEHAGFEHELLYVFGKKVNLLQRFGSREEEVPLYMKLNKLENQFVIIVSFHRQEHPLPYAFSLEREENDVKETAV